MRMSERNPSKRIPEDAKVTGTRYHFRNVVRQLVNQNKAYLRDDDGDEDDEELDFLLSGNSSGPGFVLHHNRQGQGSSLRHINGGRKKVKVESRGGISSSASSQFVMRLFDRSVDLSQFGDSSPMYTMARAWLKNKPECHNQTTEKKMEAEEMDHNMQLLEINDLPSPPPDEVHQLPPPEPLPTDGFGNPVSLRVPPPPAREHEPFCIHYEDELAPSPAILFQNHLDRWNLIRQRWRAASAYNERRYEDSISIIRLAHRKS
ncbi:unnamed protein product [Orchesella dallaii]|uniref:Protein lin-37 n=1 Tax=Orchesella dallaii TaxID=48710 RepID=A0ABP1QM87_9HEXA